MARLSWLPLLLLLSAAGARADVWEKTYPLTGRPELHAETKDGSVRIDTWDRNALGVRVVTRRWHIRPGSLEIEQHQHGNRIDLRVLERHPWISFGFSFRSIQVEIHVPREADLDLLTGDGSVNVQSVAGNITLHTGDGVITADDVRGDVALTSGDGAIVATRLDGRLHVRTGDGRGTLEGRFDGLDLTSGDGRVAAVARAGSRIGDGWSIETGDGPVSVGIPATLDAELDVHTNDGRIDCDLPVRISGRLGRREVHGDLNRGGRPLRIRTGDGSIHIGAS